LHITETGAPKTDVVVRIARRIVQIERKRTIIGAIVPIPAADEAKTHVSILSLLRFKKRRIETMN
jgi:hypothetical protein